MVTKLIRVTKNILYMETKKCTKCGRELPATLEFFYYLKGGIYKGKKYKDGLRSYCKKCWKEYKKSHKKQIKMNRKEYKKKNWNKYIYLNNLHKWVKKYKPKQRFCSICNQKRKLELSNISGKYKKDINDYWWLCHECHHFFDRINLIHK